MTITMTATSATYFRQEGIPGATTDKIPADPSGKTVFEFTEVPGSYPAVKLYAGNGFGEVELAFPLGAPTEFTAVIG